MSKIDMKKQRLRRQKGNPVHIPVECVEQISQGLANKVRWPEKTKKMLMEAEYLKLR
jgi:phage I-like protein